jgi:hypothetical protein
MPASLLADGSHRLSSESKLSGLGVELGSVGFLAPVRKTTAGACGPSSS